MHIGEVREALADAVAGLGWVTYPLVPEAPEVPAIVVGLPTQITYAETYRGGAQVTFPIGVLASRADADDAQNRMDVAFSVDVDGSLIDAIRAAVGPWRGLRVVEVGEFGPVVVGASTLLAATLTIEVRG